MFRILDLDNTISNDAHRIPKIDWQHKEPFRRYHNYHMLAAFDEPGNSHLFNSKFDNIILTARPVFYRSITEEWLRRNRVPYKFLLMRNDNDHSHSVILKELQLLWLPTLYDVAFNDIFDAFDDRQDIVDMYNMRGIAAQVAKLHDMCAWTDPKEAKSA